jgi:hypothetical protein
MKIKKLKEFIKSTPQKNLKEIYKHDFKKI